MQRARKDVMFGRPLCNVERTSNQTQMWKLPKLCSLPPAVLSSIQIITTRSQIVTFQSIYAWKVLNLGGQGARNQPTCERG